ncbi:hypothetical protein JW777_01905 [bacterium]|nr:hypothetical protein [bacterium]
MLAQRFHLAITTAAFLLAMPAFSREKVTVAVLDFEPKNVTAESAEAAVDLLRTELFNTGCFKVVERQRIQKILEEQRFQSSGVTDADQAAEIGRMLNVKKIMIGTVTLLGGTHILNTRIVDVQSGQVELAEAVESRGGEENLPRAVTELALKISYKIGLEGHVIRITGETVYIDLGSADGVKVGQTFDVIRQGEVITDLEGRTIGAQSESIATVMVTKVQDRFSETAVHSQTTPIQKGDRILPLSEKKAAPARPEPRREKPPVQKKPGTPHPEDKGAVEMPALF